MDPDEISIDENIENLSNEEDPNKKTELNTEKEENETFLTFSNKIILKGVKNIRIISILFVFIILQEFLAYSIFQANFKINLLELENGDLTANLKETALKIKIQEKELFYHKEELKKCGEKLEYSVQHCHVSACTGENDDENGEEGIKNTISGLYKSFFGESKKTMDDYLKTQEEFKNTIKELALDFPEQFRKTWIQILSSILPSLNREEDPSRPGVLMIIGTSEEFNECFSIKIANAASRIENHKIINFQKKENESELQKVIKSYLENNGKIVIVRDLDKVRKEEILWNFHAFCDNSQAVDNRAIFIFTLTVDENITAENWCHWEGKKIAKKFLENSWKSVTHENKAPIISRVAANVILLNKEKCDF